MKLHIPLRIFNRKGAYKQLRDNLVIPSCSGLLDSFGTKKNVYGGNQQSICYIVDSAEVSIVFILTVFSFIYYNSSKDTDTYIFKIADFKRYRGQTHGSKSLDIKKELLKLNEIECWFNGLDINRFATVTIEGKQVTIQSTYIYEVINAMDYLTIKPNGKHSPQYTSLVDKSIILERNNSATEIVFELCKLIERRGAAGDNQEAHIAISTLIDRCSILRGKIEHTGTISRKNQILREDIEKAMQLLWEKTSIYDTFENLEILLADKISVNKQCIIIMQYKRRIIDNEEDTRNI